MRTAERKNTRKLKNRVQGDLRLAKAVGFELLENRQLMATINVADFGATANNGSDDRTAVMNAINSSHSGDTILFSGGTFDISAEMQLPGDRTYLGQNGGTLRGEGVDGHLIKFTGDNITMRGLTIDGGGLFLEKSGGGRNTNITIDNNKFLLKTTRLHRSAITFTSGLNSSKITNNYFTGYNGGFAIYGYNYLGLTIANNEIINTDAGFHIDAFGGCGDLLVEQNYISGTKGMGMEFQSTANNLVFQDNWYENPSFTSLPGSSGGNTMAYSLILDKSSNITIRRNTAIMPIKGTTGTDYTRITFEVGGDNTLVEDNYSYGGNHVLAMNDGVGTASVNVRNNKFVNFAQNIGNSFPSADRVLTQSNNGNIRLSDVMEARIASHDTPGIGSKRYDGSVPSTPTTSTPVPVPTPAPAPTPTVPTGPSGLLALATGASTVNLFWSDKSSDETGYKIEYTRNGSSWASLATLGAGATGYTATGLVAGSQYSFRVCAFNSVGNSAWSNSSNAMPSAPASDTQFVSDMNLDARSNGWGPLELDMSNGEAAAKDGKALTINGKTYAKGLGVHAGSEVAVSLNGGYTSFLAEVGVDDEVGTAGSVVFEVWADGVLLYSSGTVTGSDGAKSVNVDVTGKQQLVLKVTNASDSNNSDHGNWGDARLVVAPVVSQPAPTPPPVSQPDPLPVPTPPAPEPVNQPPQEPASQPVPEPTPPPIPTPAPSTPTVVYLSDLQFKSAVNGWGPVELNTSVGETAKGDGKTITLNGKTYTKGLGVHSSTSDIRYSLNGNYGTFSTDIGIDDEVGSKGSVVFQVWADGVILYDSGKMTGSSVTKSINVNVQGRQELRLVVTNGGDNKHNDHADWADARLTRIAPNPTYLSDLEYSSATNGWGSVELDSSNGEIPAGDGKPITLGGKVYSKGLGVHSDSKLVYDLMGKYTTFTTDLGIDDEVGDNGSVIFQIFGDGVLLYDSGIMTGASATKTASVNVAGTKQLWLVVSNAGDGFSNDHADWANASLAA